MSTSTDSDYAQDLVWTIDPVRAPSFGVLSLLVLFLINNFEELENSFSQLVLL